MLAGLATGESLAITECMKHPVRSHLCPVETDTIDLLSSLNLGSGTGAINLHAHALVLKIVRTTLPITRLKV